MSSPDDATRSRLVELYPVLGQLAPGAQEALFASLQTLRLPAGTVLFDERQVCQ